MLIFEGLYEVASAVAVHVPLLLDDGVERGVDVSGHAGGVSTDVDAGSVLQP